MKPGGLPFEVPMRPPEEETEPDRPDPTSPGQAGAAGEGGEVYDVGPDPAVTEGGLEEVVAPEETGEEMEGVEITRRAERSTLSMGVGSAAGHDVSLDSPFQDQQTAGFAGMLLIVCRREGGRERASLHLFKFFISKLNLP